MPIPIQIEALTFTWPGASSPVIDIPAFSLAPRERLFLSGHSGSGKSTLLNLIAGVLPAQNGTLQVLGQDLNALSAVQKDRLRAEHIGYIFQQFNLLPYLNVLENISLACRLSKSRQQRTLDTYGSLSNAASALMKELGLPATLADKRVTDLSIGQQQRVAAARALIGQPDLIIADEPTSALDTQHRERFIHQLLDTCGARDIALLFVSHDTGLQKHFDRIINMHELNRSAQHVLD